MAWAEARAAHALVGDRLQADGAGQGTVREHDRVVRLAEEAILFQERLTGILDVNYAAVSNRLNQVMKVLTVMSTIFLPLTVLTGMWGMNVPLPNFAGGTGMQFWWVFGAMLSISLAMIVVFRRKGWI